jgi:hypothetical protein
LFQPKWIKRPKKQILKDPILSRLSHWLKRGRSLSFLWVEQSTISFFGGSKVPPSHEKRDYDFTLPKEDPSFISMMEEALHLRFFRIGKEEINTLTYRAVKDDLSIDLTLFQGKTIEEDLKRRDFTMNAIAFSLLDRTFHWVEGVRGTSKGGSSRTVSPLSIPRIP